MTASAIASCVSFEKTLGAHWVFQIAYTQATALWKVVDMLLVVYPASIQFEAPAFAVENAAALAQVVETLGRTLFVFRPRLRHLQHFSNPCSSGLMSLSASATTDGPFHAPS